MVKKIDARLQGITTPPAPAPKAKTTAYDGRLRGVDSAADLQAGPASAAPLAARYDRKQGRK